MRFFAPRTATNSFNTHSAWVHESGLVQNRRIVNAPPRLPDFNTALSAEHCRYGTTDLSPIDCCEGRILRENSVRDINRNDDDEKVHDSDWYCTTAHVPMRPSKNEN
jgi:hypothetical protein